MKICKFEGEEWAYCEYSEYWDMYSLNIVYEGFETTTGQILYVVKEDISGAIDGSKVVPLKDFEAAILKGG